MSIKYSTTVRAHGIIIFFLPNMRAISYNFGISELEFVYTTVLALYPKLSSHIHPPGRTSPSLILIIFPAPYLWSAPWLVYTQETVFKTFLSFSFSKPMGERYPMAEYSFFLLYTSFNACSVLRLLSRFHPLHLSMSGIAFTCPDFDCPSRL